MVCSDDEDAGKDEDEGFKADLEDPRFKQLVQDHEFALDPTDPRFVGSKKGSESLLKKLSKKKGKINNRGDRTQADEPPMERPKSKLEAPAKEDVEGVDKLELRNMVNKLKRKAERS